MKKNFFKILFFYSWETQRERQRHNTGRGRSRLHAGSPMWDSIPGPQDHVLGRRHVLNHWATQVSLYHFFLSLLIPNSFWLESTQARILVEQDAWVAQRLSSCLRLRSWPRGPGIESHIGLPAGSLLLPLPMSLPLSSCLSWINKIF